MNKIKYLFVFLSFFLIFCSDENGSEKLKIENEVSIDTIDLDNKMIKEDENSDIIYKKGDTFIIKNSSAIFVSLDSIELDILINQNNNDLDKEDFYTAMDDLNYYTFLAEENLKESNINILRTDKKVLHFIDEDSISYYIQKPNMFDYNGLVFFRPDSLPTEVDLIHFDLDYFK